MRLGCRAGGRPSCWGESWGGGAARRRWRSCRGCRGGSHQHGDGYYEAGLVGERLRGLRRCPGPFGLAPPRSENTTSGLPQEFLYYSYVADPNAMRKPGAHGLDDRFLGGEAHGQKNEPAAGFLASCTCSAGMRRCWTKRVPKPCQGLIDALCFEDVDADAKKSFAPPPP